MLKDEIQINRFKKGPKKCQPMLTFETDDFDHKPEINHIEGES